MDYYDERFEPDDDEREEWEIVNRDPWDYDDEPVTADEYHRMVL